MHAYKFDIEYVQGKHNVVANALSRRPATLSLVSICHDWKAQLLVEYSKDRRACEILEGTHNDEHYRVMADVIYYKGRIFLVLGSQLREKILHASHDSIIKAPRVPEDLYVGQRAFHMERPQGGYIEICARV